MPDPGVRSPASFRDPAGFVFRRNGRLFRQINRAGRADFDGLMTSGLYERLVGDRLLVAHRDAADVEPFDPALAERVIEPESIPFISYPYEWCFGQLQAAARLTLDVQRRAIEHGQTLKDASAYNVQFRGHEPVFIDTLSFEPYVEGGPWTAYRQFCQHFLAPLAVMALTDARLGQLLRVHLDGLPLDLAAKLLPGRSRLRPSLLIHLHLHARLQRGAGDRPGTVSQRGGFSRTAMLGLIDNLRGAVDALQWQPGRGGWAAYEREHTYTPAGWDQKARLVAEALEQARPHLVWDLGANTGRFSRVASDRRILTVSIDADPACVEWNHRQATRMREDHLLPLMMDLTNPSPAGGWSHQERLALLDRGPADLVLALALIHHLALANNVPLPDIAAFLARAGRWLVIEFVPKSDSQARRLLAARRDIFPDYTFEGFEAAFTPHFRIHRKERIAETERDLYVLERNEER
jgi:hypothetical protein